MEKKLAACALLGTACLMGQQQQPPIRPVPPVALAPTAKLPLPTLYRAFFRHVAALENAAVEREQQGDNATELRDYYGKTIGLNATQLTALKKAAFACNAAIDKQNQKAQQVIASARALIAGKRLLSQNDVPPPPAELKTLEGGRTTISNACIDDLRAAFDLATFQKIDKWVQTKFAPQVTVASIIPHAPSGPVALPPFSSSAKVTQ